MQDFTACHVWSPGQENVGRNQCQKCRRGSWSGHGRLCVGARVYLKREDLAHTGAHKINNALGQGLLAARMGKRPIIAETGAGQHGVATATVCAKLGLECVVYMGEEDMCRQALNVFRMKLLGAAVRPVSAGSRTLKDAINEAIRDWVTNVATTHYLIGSAVGPHPYPMIVRDFQSVIGRETREQIVEAERRVALIPYVMAGYPDLATCEELALGLDQAGTDFVELGVPFSDPLADGATIPAASQHALEQGVTLEDTMALAGRLSERQAPAPSSGASRQRRYAPNASSLPAASSKSLL